MSFLIQIDSSVVEWFLTSKLLTREKKFSFIDMIKKYYWNENMSAYKEKYG